MSLPQLKILRTYANMDDASIAAKKLPHTVYFSHTRHTLTIFDAYPKALFHFLILPRLRTTTATTPTITDGGRNDSSREGDGDDGDGDGGERRDESESALSLATSEAVLTSLRTLIQSAIITPSLPSPPNADEGETRGRARERAKATLRVLADEATRLRSEIEREMRARYGFAWPIWVGFHAVPSMEHLHLHVISSDLTASALKTKRHYNTFSPRVGFFIPLTKVRAWFEDTNEKNKVDSSDDGDQQQQQLLVRMATRLAPEKYEPCLKDALVCFHCGETAKNMPALKKHLQDEFDALRKREVGKLKRKREAESAVSDGGG